MRSTIPARVAMLMVLVIVALGGTVGYVGIEVSGRAIEDRLVDETVDNAAGLVTQNKWPLSDWLMTNLRGIIGSDLAATDVDKGQVIASSLPPGRRAELSRQLGQGSPSRVTLDGQNYRVGYSYILASQRTGEKKARLCLLVDEAQIRAAQDKVARTIAYFTIGAIVVASLATLWLTITVSRPIRRLVGRMDRVSQAVRNGDEPAELMAASPLSQSGPAEVVALSRSFGQLLTTLREARTKLARQSRLAAMGQLSASVAHELRNPLSGIKMNARVLADELATRDIRDPSLDLILREIDRMDAYLQELLDLAAGDGAAETAPTDLADLKSVNLAELAESVLGLLKPRMRQQRVELAWQVDAAAGPARSDPKELRRVILNLAMNALDAMPGGGVLTVEIHAVQPPTAAGPAATAPAPALTQTPARTLANEVSYGALPEGAPAVRLAITDTGGGVTVAGNADIFEPFVTGKPQGAGLGLHLCRRVILRHGGRIGYTTSPAGSTFFVDLPAAE